MSQPTLKDRINDALKTAMRAKEKERVAVLRLVMSEFKRIEVDERIDVDDARALALLDKMVKQRRDSEQQYLAAGRSELAARGISQVDGNIEEVGGLPILLMMRAVSLGSIPVSGGLGSRVTRSFTGLSAAPSSCVAPGTALRSAASPLPRRAFLAA